MLSKTVPIRGKMLCAMRLLLGNNQWTQIMPKAGWSSSSRDDWEPSTSCKYRAVNKPVCRPEPMVGPKYFERPMNCKTDEQLAVEPRSSLGFYMRCEPRYRPRAKCLPSCGERLDATLYRPSLSLHRDYQQHWAECAYRKPRRKFRIVPAEISRRTPKKKCDDPPKKWCKTHVRLECEKLSDNTNRKCPRARMCHCAPVPLNTSCRRGPKPAKCQRRLTLYPSFSECFHKPNAVKPCECRCLASTLCEMMNYSRKKRV
ncbi:uncharacterized protein LOC117591973 [Drosophila guanche]|uniref:Uncharacterized protein n=1 Tax=Drosophila guanche TaxID=7266 RepID=A0A3B0JPM5_DROGU|nr:uncharacterized protein LOC117591973 [Drosophila guanche]SPP75276.1 Hypothetical predicted protein [Drosophila guanche]